MDGADQRTGGETHSGSAVSFPSRPPVEIIERDGRWVVEEFREGRRDGETYATFDARFDAIGGARERMDDHAHPCLVRWDADDIVGNIYWNPLFERLEIRYDRLLDAWAVVPAESYHQFAALADIDAAVERARAIQREYDFKHLVAHDEDGTERERIDHRFLRRSLAESGVRFEAEPTSGDATGGRTTAGDGDAGSAAEGSAAESATSGGAAAGEAASGGAAVGNATGEGSSPVPDAVASALRRVTVESTDGPIHRFSGTWSDGRPAVVAALAPEHAGRQVTVDTFTKVVERWTAIDRSEHVTTVFDSGVGSVPWVAFRGSDVPVADHVGDRSVEARLRICKAVAIALEVAHQNRVHGIGVRPTNLVVVSGRETRRTTLSGWGLDWRVARTLQTDVATPYTAPEQLDGRLTATTGVYQLGALTYRLLTGTAPFAGATPLADAVREDTPTPPSDRQGVPAAADAVLARAMATDPSERYAGVDDLYADLLDAFQ